MALDTRIPLGVEQVDIANPLALLIQTRQNTQDRATAAQDRQREIARQSQQDQQRNTEFTQNSQLNAAKIEEFKNNKATQQYIQDTLTVKNLLDSGNARDAALVVQGMQERFKGTDYAKGLDQDFSNIVAGNLDPVLSGINSEIQAFEQMGKVTMPKAQEQRAPEVVEFGGNQIMYQGGREIGRAPVAQDPVEQVQLETAQANLEAANLKRETDTAAAQEKDILVNNELMRAYDLATGLMNRPGVSGAVGPIQGRLPVFSEAKSDARADLEELGNLLTMGNLGRMTGVLSESDIRLIASAASGLNNVASDERAIAKLGEIARRLESNPRVAEQIERTRAEMTAPVQTAQEEQPLTVSGFTIRRVN